MPKKPLSSFINMPTEQKKDFTLEPEMSSQSGPKQESIEAFQALIEAQKEQSQQQQPQKEEKKETADKKEAPFVDEADLRSFTGVHQRIQAEMASPEQERLAEKKAGKLDITTMHKFGELRQKVPIGNSGISVTFRTIRGFEGLEMMKLLEAQTDRSYNYYDALASIYLLAASIWAINDDPLPNHLRENKFDKEVFRKKVQIISGLPDPLISAISIHYSWFDRRARKLFMFRDEEGETEAEKQIKNG